ncbi:MAG: IS982 family transposase [Janthinobacterium lividum]
MIDFNKISDIFYLVDEFCKDFDNSTKGFILGKPSKRPAMMSKSEVISMCMLFHLSGFRCFKHFYMFYVQRHMQGEFPRTVSYNRFVELSQGVLLPMAIFLKTCCLGSCSGISFVDSTPIRVCHNKRIKRNKVFKGIAEVGKSEVGKSTMGWFYGFKLHIVINDKGEILNFAITQANVDDREPLKNEGVLKAVFGKLFADKGYISEKLARILFVGDIHLIIATLIAYSFFPKKPAIAYQTVTSNQIVAF